MNIDEIVEEYVGPWLAWTPYAPYIMIFFVLIIVIGARRYHVKMKRKLHKPVGLTHPSNNSKD